VQLQVEESLQICVEGNEKGPPSIESGPIMPSGSFATYVNRINELRWQGWPLSSVHAQAQRQALSLSQQQQRPWKRISKVIVCVRLLR
jgi:hypothetical protein